MSECRIFNDITRFSVLFSGKFAHDKIVKNVYTHDTTNRHVKIDSC
jgi:hypothetical protein